MLTSDEVRIVLKTINKAFQKRLGIKPYQINYGNCYHWAYIAHRLIGGKLMLTEDKGGHAWLKYNGFYYDSESIGGTPFFGRLKLFQHNGLPGVVRSSNTIKEFIDLWDKVGYNKWQSGLCRDIIKECKRQLKDAQVYL